MYFLPLGSFLFFPVTGVCEAFPAGKRTLQAAGPSVQRERSLGTSYATDIWQIDLTSLSPPLLDNAPIPRVKSLLNAGTLKMRLASALQSSHLRRFELKEGNSPLLPQLCVPNECQVLGSQPLQCGHRAGLGKDLERPRCLGRSCSHSLLSG